MDEFKKGVLVSVLAIAALQVVVVIAGRSWSVGKQHAQADAPSDVTSDTLLWTEDVDEISPVAVALRKRIEAGERGRQIIRDVLDLHRRAPCKYGHDVATELMWEMVYDGRQ